MSWITNETFWKIATPIITFSLGSLFSYFLAKRQVRVNLRAMPHIDNLYLPIPFDETYYKVKENTKLYVVGDYDDVRGPEAIYLRVTNLGPGHMVNCKVRITVNMEGHNEDLRFNVNVPIISKDEYVLIPVVDKAMSGRKCLVTETMINYYTQLGEKFYFEEKTTKIDNKSIISTKVILNDIFLDKTILEFEGENNTFIHLNSKK
ncbi:hypothetical protein AB4114_10925 [Paenibacillus sp. 2RAB27]|uniref:hypothetical protein n=1 Tax=Paenibacillus sp. 2RAB27 TaxID=3232991 RepID=UPI003F9B1131